jgi:hypothetical protein
MSSKVLVGGRGQNKKVAEDRTKRWQRTEQKGGRGQNKKW